MPFADFARKVLDTVRSSTAPAAPRATRPAGRPSDRPAAGPLPDSDRPPVVAYAPELDGDPDPGEVVWTWVAFEEDPTQGKDRPVLVLGIDGGVLDAVMLTSKDHTDRGDVMPLGSGPWDREGRPSFVKLDRILQIDPKAVRREGAILDRARFDAVVARVFALHGWTAPGS